MVQIDAHQHFWRYSAERFGWIEPGGPLACDRMPEDVKPLLDATGFAGCVAVQAEQDEAETDWLLSLAADHSWILGVVGWTDLTASDLDTRLARWRGMPLVGIRHMVQDDPDPRWLLRADAQAGVRTLLAEDLAYDILVRGSAQLLQVPAFLDAVGDGALVLDHGGKPDIAGGEWQPWADTIRAIAGHPNVACKLSGLVTEADHAAWSADEIERYLDHLLACFGPERLIFGSDWPVCTLAADHGQVVALVDAFIQRACPDHRAAVFGETARRLYKLAEPHE
ncbi:amidohydrolase family protein [Sphingomonas sp. PL-96]|uniref:amidohydrolase family protein n=1 Tax=Sphingomonas sp. PL-96 TaxID=2887201 RepID=UPI001E584F09|nr:amidohydrolase family protein [Sphingomonas sp. PL-96]MCC2975185.1 amidohydrolase family protein [Sphingomonas sp. PL-96]